MLGVCLWAIQTFLKAPLGEHVARRDRTKDFCGRVCGFNRNGVWWPSLSRVDRCDSRDIDAMRRGHHSRRSRPLTAIKRNLSDRGYPVEMWWALSIVAILALFLNRGPSAVGGGMTIGFVGGLILATIRPAFEWSTVGKATAICMIVGLVVEVAFKLTKAKRTPSPAGDD